MANQDAPNGFHFHRDRFGDARPRIVHYDIASSVVGTIGRGQPCLLNSAGNIVEMNGTYATDVSTPLGVFIAQKACVASDLAVPFIPTQGMDFIVQADDNASWTTEATLKAVMQGAAPWHQITNIAALSADGLKRSTAELAGSGAHATNGYIRIVGWVDDPSAVFGPFQNVIVRFNPTLNAGGPEFSL